MVTPQKKEAAFCAVSRRRLVCIILYYGPFGIAAGQERGKFMTVWFICIHCERAFSVSLPNERPMTPDMCPFDGCDGGEGDIWEWVDFIDSWVMPYPEIPIYGVKYPLYPGKDDIDRIRKLHKSIISLP